MISVVIPAYREEKNVGRTVSEIDGVLRSFGEPYEIILVDDGSPDATFMVARALIPKYPALRVVQHAKNQGPGAAFRTGFRETKGDQVVTIDCDLSFDPQAIPDLVKKLVHADVVIGAQHGSGAAMENIPWIRILCSKVAFFFDALVFGGHLPSYSSFFVAYRGDLIRGLEFACNGFDAQCEIDVKLMRCGARIIGHPCTLKWRDKRRQSSMKLFREARKRLALWQRFNRFRS